MNKALISAEQVRFFSGSSNPILAAAIANELGVPLDNTRITRFSNDNLFIQLGETVRYRRVYIVQSLSQPVNDHLMELLMMLDIARSAAASEVHAIIPYYSFARSDKKDAPRISITARLVADLLKTAGATHVMSMLFHSPQVHGFFSLPTDPLSSWQVFKQYLKSRDLNEYHFGLAGYGTGEICGTFCTGPGDPDRGREQGTYFRYEGQNQRPGRQPGRGHKCALIYDDEIATGGSIHELCRVLIEEGIEEIWSCVPTVYSPAAAWNGWQTFHRSVRSHHRYCVHPARKNDIQNLRSFLWHPIFADAIRHNMQHQSLNDLYVFGE